ncbi:Uncharacterised protein [Mycobacterium tuberculosis]|uniref:Exported repetitive protein PirG n=1 Tax=Mycobacterium tuberculosis TaxID=1773 RepID=A0A654TT31_MYCTX|nr:Uncharacterised protein [Mycobacterium tuberculosis]CKP96845.1 Uncharacterised protein [Mycobacterium tuberculosis]CNM43668.1 Uncharacterised protein [Mycobacterium tuberculosis]CNM54246.1 Uncharacterised protein [Mycobacterium tuberculosis]CNM80012.1 Uncharacterised protein [Mycobacterium tuberculosis]
MYPGCTGVMNRAAYSSKGMLGSGSRLSVPPMTNAVTPGPPLPTTKTSGLAGLPKPICPLPVMPMPIFQLPVFPMPRFLSPIFPMPMLASPRFPKPMFALPMLSLPMLPTPTFPLPRFPLANWASTFCSCCCKPS